MAQCKTCKKELKVETDGVINVRLPCCSERKLVCGKNKRKDPCGSTVQVRVAPYDSTDVLVAWCAKHADDSLMEITRPAEIAPDEPSDYELDYMSESLSGVTHKERVLTGTKKQVLALLSKDKHAGVCTACDHAHKQCERDVRDKNPDHKPTTKSHWAVVCPKCGAIGFKYD